MKIVKRITVVVTKNIDGEFFEKKVAFDSFEQTRKYLIEHPDLNYFKVQIWRIEEPSAQGDLL